MSDEVQNKPPVDAEEKKKMTLRVIILDVAAFVLSFVMVLVKGFMINGSLPNIPGVIIALLVVTIALVVLAIIASYKASSKKLLSKGITVLDIVLTVIAIWNVLSTLRYLGLLPF